MPKFPNRGLLSLVALLAIVSQTPSTDDLDKAYMEAPSRPHSIESLERLDLARKPRSMQIQKPQRDRGEVEATVRNPKLTVDRLP